MRNLILLKTTTAMLALFFGTAIFAQSVATGTVTDSNGEPVIGAAVVVSTPGESGISSSAITDNDGKFSVEAAKGQTMNITSLGYKDMTITISDKSVYNIMLSFDEMLLEETVVVGYGTQKKVNLTGSVATMDSKALEGKPIVQASAALQGMVPGVTVTTQSGGPGDDGGVIRIRGINSFGGSSTSPLVLIDGIEGSLDSVDPALIESISVLKDAASSSIYGSRAANGVILVTTKRGSEDRFSISYSGYVGWQEPTDLPKTVNALQFKELTNAMNLQDEKDPTYDEETMYLWRKNAGKDPDLYPDTNWQKAVLTGSGLTHSHSVSLGIGTERIKMLTTFGYSSQDGLIENSSYKRFSFRNNADVKFSDKLSLKMDISFSNGDKVKSPYQGTIFNYMNTRPADIPNQFSTGLYNGQGLQGNNPVALMKYGGRNTNNALRLSGAATLTYKPIEWLTLQGMVAPRYTTGNNHNWKKPVTTYQDMEGTSELTSTPFATLTESGSRSFYGNYNFLITFDKKFNGGHDFKLTIGTERNTFDYKYIMAYREGFNYDDYDQIDAGEIENMDNAGRRFQWAIQSFFGRVNYSYKERYLLEANIRIDGSSRFTKANRWGYFPSVSGAWRISEEPFMAKAKHVVNGLKLRASKGVKTRCVKYEIGSS